MDQKEVLRQFSPKTASGIHLDLWGQYHDCERRDGECDRDYRARLLAHLRKEQDK